MSAAAQAVQAAVEQTTNKPVNPKSGKGGTVVKKGLRNVPTNGHKQVHLKLDIERNATLRALRYALGDASTSWAGEAEREAAQRVRERLEARL